LLAAVNAALEQRHGAPKLAMGMSASAILLDRKLVAARGLDAEAVALSAREALLAQPNVAAAYTRGELQSGSRAGAPLFEQMRKSWSREVSGDVQYVLKPNFMFGSSTSIATHGSPYEYDTHVPLLVWGPRWVQAGSVAQRVEVADIAPTLARMLGVAAPAASEGRPLPLAALTPLPQAAPSPTSHRGNNRHTPPLRAAARLGPVRAQQKRAYSGCAGTVGPLSQRQASSAPAELAHLQTEQEDLDAHTPAVRSGDAPCPARPRCSPRRRRAASSVAALPSSARRSRSWSRRASPGWPGT
jgi:hypothetical protein